MALADALVAAKELLADAASQEAAAKAVSAVALLAPFAGVQHPHVPFLTGAALQRLGHNQEAAEQYERSLQLSPELIWARVNLVNVYMALEPPQLDKALLHAEEACVREPHSADRLWLLALVLQRAGQDEAAQRALQRCLALDPRNIPAYVNLDALYLKARKASASHALAGLAIRESERSGGAFFFWTHPLQRPPHVHKGLTAQPWWNPTSFPWMAVLEANADMIRGELCALAPLSDVATRSAHDASLVSRGCWKEHVLLSATTGSGVVHSANRCPRTTALLLGIPALVGCARNGVGEAIFSVLGPKTHLRPHCASTNQRLTCHLPLLVPKEGCRLRVGDETRAWAAGKCLCFDDSFEHEAFNDSDETRVILLLNFYHPELHPSDWKPLPV